MADPIQELDPKAVTWTYRLGAALLILGAAALRLWYLADNCPLDLCPDEAHYWQWSRQLDWSYYSKGPLVAWVISLSCWLTGAWSVQLTGSEMLAVRLPAVICGSLLLAGLYTLTAQVHRRESVALGVVAIALTLPPITAGSLLMTIDAPFTCLWVWALVFGYQALFCGSRWAWPAVGLAVGVGILAKYTMVLWPISLLCFLLASPAHRPLLRSAGLWISAVPAAICCVPIILWNIGHDWVGLWHVSHLAASQQAKPRFFWNGPLVYLGLQFGILLGAWFIVWARAMWARRPGRDNSPPTQYLWWMSFVTFALFFSFGFTTNGGEANWPVAGYLSGMVLAAGWLQEEWQRGSAGYRRVIQVTVAGSCALGLALTLLLTHSHQFTPLLSKVVPPATEQNPVPVRKLDPTCRLRGWQTLARAIDAEMADLRAKGMEPLLGTTSWTLPGELEFYCQEKQVVHNVGLALGARHSQHDLWRPNPVFDPDRYLGQTFLLVGDFDPVKLEKAFAKIGPSRIITHFEAGIPIAVWKITLCHGFRGFAFVPGQNQKF